MITPNFKKFKIEAYKPGKSKVKKLKNAIKLSANESALGMSPKAKKIISNKNLNCEKKNFFSGFFIALAIQLNQRIIFVLDVI